MALSEEKLVEGCIKGKREMQQALYEKFSGKMFAVALRYAKAQQEAEDILQEAFIKVFQSLDTFRGDSSLIYWLKRIVVNTALNHQRGKLYMYPMVDEVRQFSDFEFQSSRVAVHGSGIAGWLSSNFQLICC